MSGTPWIQASAIIPARNAAATLPDTIDSLRRQTIPPLEVIVVDDVSDDDTAAVAERLGATVLRNATRRNAGGARNHGIEHAHGNVLAFLDADAAVSETWLERVQASFDRDPNVVAVGGRIVNGRPGRWGDLDWFLNHSEWIGGRPGPKGTFPTMAIAYRRDAVGDIRFPETTLGEDTFFARAVLRQGGLLWWDPEIVITHRHQRLAWKPFWGQQLHAGRTWYETRSGLVDRPGRLLVKCPLLLLGLPHLWIVLGRLLRRGLGGRALVLLPWMLLAQAGRIAGFLDARRQHRARA